MSVALPIPRDHAAFDGHFPGTPILPGAVLLDEALREIARSQSLDLTRWTLSAAKFLEIVRPGDELTLDHEKTAAGTIRFTIRNGARPVATGSLSPRVGAA